MFILRLIEVVVVAFGVALVRRVLRAWRSGRRPKGPGPKQTVPRELLGEGAHTWVVFTSSRDVASVDQVVARLSALDAAAHVTIVDAEREPYLAKALGITSTPAVLLADRAGAFVRQPLR